MRFLLLLLAGPLSLLAQPLNEEESASVQKSIATLIKSDNIPGVSIAISRGSRVVYEQGYGFADLENEVAVRPETRFRTASIAKPMTAVAILRLAERKKLDLDAPISTTISRWPKKRWPVTPRQLLGHLGGVRHYNRPGESHGTKAFPSLGSTLGLFAKDPLLHEPGTRFHYTTFGFSLLGLVIEHAAGKDYMDVLQREVFGPAGMRRTVQDSQWALIRNRSRGYRHLDKRWLSRLPKRIAKKLQVGQIINARLHDTSMKVPGGGLLSTSGDLVRFGQALMNGKLLSPESLKMMWTSQKTKDGKPTHYGLGWGVGTRKGRRIIAHSGSQAGTSCVLVLLPDRQLAVSIMSNLRGAKNLVSTGRNLALELAP